MTDTKAILERIAMRAWVIGNPDAAADEIIRLKTALQSPAVPREVVEVWKKLDKAAFDVVTAKNMHEAKISVHYLNQALKDSHKALALLGGKEG